MVTLSGLSSLRELDLSQTKITDAGLAILAGSKSLRSVIVRETEVTDAGIAEGISWWLKAMNDVTRILAAIEQGDGQAAEQLLPLVYDELRKLAAARMAAENPGTP